MSRSGNGQIRLLHLRFRILAPKAILSSFESLKTQANTVSIELTYRRAVNSPSLHTGACGRCSGLPRHALQGTERMICCSTSNEFMCDALRTAAAASCGSFKLT